MQASDRVLPPDELLTFLDRRLPSMSRCYGALVTHEPDGRAVKRGTVTFCRYGGRCLLLTAAHVASQHVGRDSTLLTLELDEHDVPILETFSRGRRTVFQPTAIFSDDTLDVAGLEVPEHVAGMTGLTWFDLDDCARVTRKAASYFLDLPRDQTLPTLAMGFGNYGVVEDTHNLIQVLAGGPLFCELRAWDAEDVDVPQMTLEPSVEPEQVRARELPVFERHLVQRLSVWDDGAKPEPPAAFGGYSGGPILFCSQTSEHVIGIIKQGTRRPGAARILATPLTAISDLLKSAMR
jgi:hypothetical protein